jgi:parvulin-like peptidyl-prolyl isomerase
MLKFLRGGGKHTKAIWWVIAITSGVVFVFGFSVAPSLLGRATGSGSDVLGKVDGIPITAAEYQQAITQTNESYAAQTGRDPDLRERGVLQEQAWGQLVTERALVGEAKRLGFGASDPEVVFAIRNTPPGWVRQLPYFQTEGQFDFAKYHRALADPNVDWSGLEDEVRRMLPAQKLEEMMLASARFSEPELQRAFISQYERAQVSLAMWIPHSQVPDTTSIGEEEVRSYYEQHPGFFSGPAMVKVEMVTVPRSILPEDREQTLETARALVAEARAGADFSQLASDMSQGPLAKLGGDMGQLQASQIPAAARLPIEALGDSGITEPLIEENQVFIFKSVRAAAGPEPVYHLWQIALPVEASPAALEADAKAIVNLRQAAKKGGLGPAAARTGMASNQSGWFSATSFDPQVFNAPQVQQFAIMSEVGALSPTYGQETGWVLAQVIDRRQAGLYPLESVVGEVKISMARERLMAAGMEGAKRARAEIEAGADFMATTQANGATQTKVTEMFTRESPDPVMGGTPRGVGLAFGLEPGQLGGPILTPLGVYLIRKDAGEPAPLDQYDQLKGQVSERLLVNRQQQAFATWLEWYREQSQVEDWRGDLQ